MHSFKSHWPASLLLFVFFCPAAGAQAPTKLVLEAAETAGMSMFRPHWDTPIPLSPDGPTAHSWDGAKDKTRGAAASWAKDTLKGKPGAIAFDALNRSIMVRFPDATEKVAAAIKAGGKIQKVELILPYRDEELFPPGGSDYRGAEGYNFRANWGVGELYNEERPEWHAVAWALRKPWKSDTATGPTFNAAVNGKLFWTKYGAQDDKTDRFANRFGPAEVSYKRTEAMDITSTLVDPAYGASLGQRLRRLADCGFLVQKWETYDHRFFTGVYEWATSTGGRGILIQTPRLEITLAPGEETVGAVPPAADLTGFAPAVAGKPTAIIPTDAEIEKLAQQLEQKPAWMPAWQWERVQELLQVGGVKKDPREPLWVMFVPQFKLDNALRQGYWAGPGDYRYKAYAKTTDVYKLWIDNLLVRQPRGWSGFETATEFNEWQVAKEVLPGPALDAIKRYWTAWLMPDRETAPESRLLDLNWMDGSLVHPMVDQLKGGSNTNAKIKGDSYFLKTGDWRGNKSFFRSGFNYSMSTQNFNTTASTGAFLFGTLINAPRAIADGKAGINRWLLNGWTLSDGIGQEFLDHYYYTVSLKGLKALQNGAEDESGQLLADSLVNKGVLEAMVSWHPNLKTTIAPSGRTSLNYLLGTQDGINYLMNIFSRKGVLKDVGLKKFPGDYEVFGSETPAALVAGLSMQKPWVWEDVANQADTKPLPYEMTAWGRGTWNRTWLSQHYGMGSALQFGGRIQAMAQWRRAATEVKSARQLGTMDVRMGVNDTRWANDAGGWIGQPFKQTVVQKDNTWLVAGSPNVWNGGFSDGKVPVKSFQASLGLFDLAVLEPNGKAPWEIYLDGKKVEQLPVKARHGQAIVIKDGVTFIGVKALPSPNLGRDTEVLLREGVEQVFKQYGNSVFKPGLEINSYLVKGEADLTKEFNWYGLEQGYAGFAVQVSDSSEGSFEAFLKRMEAAKVATTFDSDSSTLSATGQIGATSLTMKMVTAAPKNADGGWDAGFQGKATDILANGKPAYPSGMVLLDSPLEHYGWNSIEKNGAKLVTSLAEVGGTRLLLQSSPDKKRFVAWNTQGTASDLHFTLPGNLQVRSDGMLGLARIEADIAQKTLLVRHAYTDGRLPGGKLAPNTNASALLLGNFPEGWKVTLNEVPYTAHLARATMQGTAWRVLPLVRSPRTKEEMTDLLLKMDGARAARQAANPNINLLHYHVAGLFPATPGPHGPETDVAKLDLSKVYPAAGLGNADVKWRNSLDFMRGTPLFGVAGGSPKMGEGIYFFRIPPEKPTPPGTYYLLATLRSAREQEVMMNFQVRVESAPPAELKFWLNGKLGTFSSPTGSQERVTLKSGINQILFKIRQDDNSRGAEQPLLSLGEPTFGLPTLQDVEWKALDGNWVPVNPGKKTE